MIFENKSFEMVDLAWITNVLLNKVMILLVPNCFNGWVLLWSPCFKENQSKFNHFFDLDNSFDQTSYRNPDLFLPIEYLSGILKLSFYIFLLP